MPDKQKRSDPRTGPLVPVGKDGVVVIQNPPDAPMHLTPDQADISGVRLMDAAEKALGKTPS